MVLSTLAVAANVISPTAPQVLVALLSLASASLAFAGVRALPNHG